MLHMTLRRFLLVLTLIAMPLIIGSQCAVLFSSGGDNDDDDDKDDNDGLVIIARSGNFVDAPVEGVNYESGSIFGITGSNGEFQYEAGNTIRFFIGDIELGRAVKGKSLITPLDLVEGGAADTPAVINIARLLQSLDSNPGDELITIPEEVRAAAVRSNSGIASAIEYLDFHDEPAFVNAASQLVAVLTRNYTFTAALVDAANAHDHMVKSIAAQPK